MSAGMFLTIAYLVIIVGAFVWLGWEFAHAPIEPPEDEIPDYREALKAIGRHK